MSIPFLKEFKKYLEKAEISTNNRPPKYWYSVGNYALNKLLSGSYHLGIAGGRVAMVAGPSKSGKSFLIANIAKNAQREHNAFVIAMDSEKALDQAYYKSIGVDLSPEKFLYMSVQTIEDVVKSLSKFQKSYVETYGLNSIDNPKAPQILFILDSIDMLNTESEDETFQKKGEIKGDQGQRAKQFKNMLRQIVHMIAPHPMTMLIAHQVYKNQDQFSPRDGKWVINPAMMYSATQIIKVDTPRNLEANGEKKGVLDGITLLLETAKTRYAKPGTKLEIDVPYDTGVDKYSGLTDMLKLDGVFASYGTWKTTVPDENGEIIKYQSETDEILEQLLKHPIVLASEKKVFDKIQLEDDLADEQELDEAD